MDCLGSSLSHDVILVVLYFPYLEILESYFFWIISLLCSIYFEWECFPFLLCLLFARDCLLWLRLLLLLQMQKSFNNIITNLQITTNQTIYIIILYYLSLKSWHVNSDNNKKSLKHFCYFVRRRSQNQNMRNW